MAARRRDIAVKTVRDNWEDRWSVYEIRPTDHGWPIYLGRPQQEGRSLNRVGGNRVILTKELVEYLRATRHDRGGCKLPVGKTAVKRLRKLLGLNMYDDMRQWWEGHADELATVTETEFAERHGYSLARVSQMNKAMFGKRLRDPGWWRTEPARSLLAGLDPRQAVAEELDISVGAVGRLRWVLRQEMQGEESHE